LRVLLLYITERSGHNKASLAIEKALKVQDPSVETLCVNSFNYTNPILEKIINRTYMGIIKRTPEVWEYLYDNPGVVRNTQRLKSAIHQHNSKRLKSLLDSFNPDVIVATQAFPCGIVADIKKTFNLNVPLIAVLTDFYPHSYWIYDAVDRYIVPTEEAKARLIHDGIYEEKIKIYGIPIDIKFNRRKPREQIKNSYNLDPVSRTILVMGGGGGLGPIKIIISTLDKLASDMQIIVVTGSNEKLYKYLTKKAGRFKKKLLVFGYTDNIDELMEVSDIVVTKPGGITVSEALAKCLPILIVNPIPGQEAKNTKFLIASGAAIKADNQMELATLLENLFSMPSKLKVMSEAAARIGKPSSASDIAAMILSL